MDTEALEWLLYLKRNRRRTKETIYIKPGQRILAVKPPYILPKRGIKTIKVLSIERLKSMVANT